MQNIQTPVVGRADARWRQVLVTFVEDDQGHQAAARLFGPEAGVTWMSLTAVAAVGKVLAGQVRPGFQTPAMVYGSDFALDLPGVTRQDVS